MRIIAVVRRPSERVPASSAELLALVEQASAASAGFADLAPGPALVDLLDAVAAPLVAAADALLHGIAGVRTLLADPGSCPPPWIADGRDRGPSRRRGRGRSTTPTWARPPSSNGQRRAGRGSRTRSWAVRRDRLPTAGAVADLAGAGAGPAAIAAFTSVQQALSAIDRLEVRGRDSRRPPRARARTTASTSTPRRSRPLLDARADDPLFASGAVRARRRRT